MYLYSVKDVKIVSSQSTKIFSWIKKIAKIQLKIINHFYHSLRKKYHDHHFFACEYPSILFFPSWVLHASWVYMCCSIGFVSVSYICIGKFEIYVIDRDSEISTVRGYSCPGKTLHHLITFLCVCVCVCVEPYLELYSFCPIYPTKVHMHLSWLHKVEQLY